MNMVNKYKILIFCIGFLLTIPPGCEKLTEDYNQKQYENPVKIAVVGDVSVLREQVENMFFGAQLAMEEINQKGGLEIDGEKREIQLIFKNSGGNPDQGTEIVYELYEENIDLIIGPTFSSVAVEMAEACVNNNMLMISYSATTPELTMLEDKDLVWRTCPSDHTFGTLSAQYCVDSLQLKNAAILYRDDRFGTGLAQILEEMFTEFGGSVLASVSFPGDEINLSSYDFSYEMNTVFRNEIDVLFIVAFNSEIAVLTNRIYNNSSYQSLNKKPFIFVNDGILPEEILTNGSPELLDDILGISSTNEGNPNYALYKENYISRFGFLPATYSEHAYDAVYCLAYAMQRGNTTNPLQIKEYLREISGEDYYNPVNDVLKINVNEFDIGKNILLKGNAIDYEGATGPINFDINGDPVPKIIIWGFENEQYVELSYYEK
ncbi:MAG: ABC transporter substrate-binding protein [Bacteroidales bacterium]|jgi:ABC-type branched-subunit amino acid transport system substrate-binding protein|nr:ABC transporter substrate-binding protein [Bacteroidales bacterium]